MTAETPRRDFLLGRPAADAPEPAAPVEPQLVHISRRAMACEFEICLPAGPYAAGTEAALEALDLVDQLEEQMSVFRPSSEICRINRMAAEGPVEVEPRLFALLEQAMDLFRQTQGAYDITVGPLWEVWGFARRAGAVPRPEQLAEVRSRVGGQFIALEAANKTIRFLRPGVQLNLGSIGKGYAVDRAAEHLLASGVGDFLVHGGNSSVLARGSRWGDFRASSGSLLLTPRAPCEAGASPAREEGRQNALPPGRSSEIAEGKAVGWTVGLRDPLHRDRRWAEIHLRDRALGTSGAQFQSFRHKGRRYGHILDPRTGWPAEGVLSATAIAPSAALADGLSTAFYVMGPAAALDYCRRHPEIAAAVIGPAAKGGGGQIHVAGLSEDLREVLP